jgi:hypothetical protein
VNDRGATRDATRREDATTRRARRMIRIRIQKGNGCRTTTDDDDRRRRLTKTPTSRARRGEIGRGYMFRRRETAGGMATPTALRTATNDDGDEARTPTPLRSALKKGARRDATRRDAMGEGWEMHARR